MAHYALLNADNIVMKVITGNDENDDRLPSEFSSWEEFYADQQGYDNCKRTSYNTKNNQHLNGGTPFRGNHAGVGLLTIQLMMFLFLNNPMICLIALGIYLVVNGLTLNNKTLKVDNGQNNICK